MNLKLFFLSVAAGFSLFFSGCDTALNQSEPAPRIVNLVNFIRQNDYRVEHSDSLLFQTVEEQIKLFDKYRLPATFLLQYDALIRPEYQNLLKQAANRGFEVGGWFEITRPHVEDAGLVWRGEHAWVSHANIAFSTGYTPEERTKLVDVYMKKFKEVFGDYPKSVGSWYIDAYTLNYMYEKYGIIASCNCKDQIGTDGYTLWGGYWNQAYYPSKQNGYMPAQTIGGQIPVPVFRMLGSDPIYQYDNGRGTDGQGVISLEPVYPHAGMNRKWVDYFFNSIVEQPCLAFNYTQAGQENSFTWEPMRKGLEMQIPLIDSLRRAGKVRVETLEKSGRWFKENFKLTPATAVTVLQDVRNEGNKTVWFNSRHYRVNLMWRNQDNFSIRDLHLFDEHFKSDYLDKAGEGSRFFFYTLPVVDEHRWSTPDKCASMQLYRLFSDGGKQLIRLREPVVTEESPTTLLVECNDGEGHRFRIRLTEERVEVSCPNGEEDFLWSLDLWVPDASVLPFREVTGSRIEAEFNKFPYALTCEKGSASLIDNGLRLSADNHRLVLKCTAE